MTELMLHIMNMEKLAEKGEIDLAFALRLIAGDVERGCYKAQ